jgi:thioester reductase-like protein
MVTHDNVLHNARSVLDHRPTGVSWLPQFHDLGLVGYYLFPMVTGGTTYGLAPWDFLKHPAVWFQVISRVRATYASAPQFAFEFCLRKDRVREEDLTEVDLSSLRVLMNASEPIRPSVYSRFLQRFQRYGLQPQAGSAAYGLAENTLGVTTGGRRSMMLDRQLFQRGVVRQPRRPGTRSSLLSVQSAGTPVSEVGLRIVDPHTRCELPERTIGEIWVSGPSVCQGYWGRPARTREIFRNRLAENSAIDYLRTGDLGFLDRGELFVCGRIKEIIILRGLKFYPQDIEWAVLSAMEGIRGSAVVAFQEAGRSQRLVVLVESLRAGSLPEVAEICAAIRRECGIQPQVLAIVPPRTIVRTTSGKLARTEMRKRWLAGRVPVLTRHHFPVVPAASMAAHSDLRALLRSLGLTGNESCTLLEAGLDSVALASVGALVRPRLGDTNLTPVPFAAIDIRALGQLPVKVLCKAFHDAETGGGPTDSLRTELEVLAKSLLNEASTLMMADVSARAQPRIEMPADTARSDDILVTGATGFFGPFLLASLLRSSQRTVHVLVRATDQAQASTRIHAALQRSRSMDPTVQAAFATRVHCHCADLSRPQLGLDSRTWRKLASTTGVVVHNAAAVDYLADYGTLRPHNVEGTRELIRLSTDSCPKEFHHISSTVIFGWTPKGTLYESDCNSAMEHLDFGYAQSKWVAEQIVFDAQRRGLFVRVYRPSFITASHSGVASGNDIVIRLLAFMIKYRLAVRAHNQISFLPADLVADHMASMLECREIPDSTLHMVADDYCSMVDVAQCITRLLGCSFEYCDVEQFVRKMNRLAVPEDPIFPLVNFFERSCQPIIAMEHKRYASENYRRARSLCGARALTPLLEVVSYLLSYMSSNGLIHQQGRHKHRHRGTSNHIDDKMLLNGTGG